MHAHEIQGELRKRGFVHVTDRFRRDQYRQLASELGSLISEESIALRPGAHAYVAKPGRVPFHTDHPQVDVIAWLCERQDDRDGASLLVDAKPIIEALAENERATLRQVNLICPPLSGGPPTEQWPVLTARTQIDALFCSPWLKPAAPVISHELSLERFRLQLSEAAKTQATEVRLLPGEMLFVDNTRILHGRRALLDSSPRRLHRLWVRLKGGQQAASPTTKRGHMSSQLRV